MAERTGEIEDPVEACIIEAGDLEYKALEENVTTFGEGRWRRRDFPRSMLIQFATEADVARALRDGVVMLGWKATGEPT